MKRDLTIWQVVQKCGPHALPFLSYAIVAIATSWIATYLKADTTILDLEAHLHLYKADESIKIITNIFCSRLAWNITALAYVFACLACVIGCTCVILGSLSDRPILIRLLIIVAAIILAPILYLFYSPQEPIVLEHDVIQDLVTQSLQRMKITGMLRASQWLNIFTYLAVPFLLVGASATLATRKDENIIAQEHLACQMRRTRITLFLSAVLLSAGVANTYAYYNFSCAIVHDQELAEINNFIVNLTFYDGANYTLLLACIYIPLEVLLNKRAQRLSKENIKDATARERKEWIIKNNLKFTPLQEAVGLSAALAPLLASGSISTFFDFLKF